ncbi:MAG: RdgB/HAM1 family non-canonical purine NTP pyrophosphatase [Myxococcota bacterium]
MATQSEDKVREVCEMLEPIGYTVEGAFDLTDYSVVEDGESFEANALKKAQAMMTLTGEMSIADDSGIEVDALGGRPGIFSARYAGVAGPSRDRANLEKMLRELEGIPAEQRAARYICAMVLCCPGQEPEYFRGVLEGSITESPRGTGGFGYDPIFLVGGDQRTAAELTSDEKHAISHRGKATRALMAALLAR